MVSTLPRMINWPDLTFPAINLWNVWPSPPMSGVINDQMVAAEAAALCAWIDEQVLLAYLKENNID